MTVCLHDPALDHERVARGVALVSVHARAVAHRETHGVHGGLKATDASQQRVYEVHISIFYL